MITVLKPSALKAATGKILDDAIERPQYVSRAGVLLVLTKADRISPDDPLLSPWEFRAQSLESFYDPAKTW